MDVDGFHGSAKVHRQTQFVVDKRENFVETMRQQVAERNYAEGKTSQIKLNHSLSEADASSPGTNMWQKYGQTDTHL